MPSRVPLPPRLTTTAFSYREGIDAGLGHGRLRGRDLQRPFYGTRHSSRGELSLEQRCRALQSRIPDHAFFCGITAAALIGIPLPYRLGEATDVHVGTAAPARALHARGISGHRLGIRPEEIDARRGLRLTTPARTWCDLAPVLTLPELVSAGDFLLRRGSALATKEQLEESVGHHPGRRGRPALRIALDLVHDRSESPAESLLRVILTTGGFTGMQANHVVRDRAGRFLARVDLAFPDQRVAIEYEGDYHRTERDRWRKDMIRMRRLEAAGWRVLRVNADDLRDPARLLMELARVLALRSTR